LLAAILLGLCIALNPLVGAFSVLLIVGQALLCNSGELLSQIITWAKLGAVSAIIAVPFIAPLLLNAGASAAPDKQLPFVGDGAFFNILGPCLLLALMSAFVALKLSAKQQKVILLASILAVLFSFSSLPFSNEYKFPRLFAIFLAIPAGAMVVRYVKGWVPMLALGILAILSMPTMFSTIKAYAYWNVSQSLPLTTSSNGDLVSRLVDDNLQPAIPQSVLEAIQELDSDAVIMMHPRFPKVASMAQGNQWAPALQHTLLVDRPQIHNYAYSPEVLSRLGLVVSFWGSNDWPATADPDNYVPQPALSQLRQIVAGRSLAILSTASSTASHDYLHKLRDSGDVSLVAEQGDVYLWSFSAVQSVVEN
jgi:hypothetical protein